MKKWVLSALAYLIVVVGAYYAYSIVSPPVEDQEHTNIEQHNE
ncbi:MULTISPECIES: hypothetical protein [Bacillaceae]|uniref:Uncharacterized protein n=1 Tax=Metabacillus malikii TaxID=1504265 RepID=A0ABT9ZMI1_9BACI|nr:MULTISPECIES: hypothetical protein [Bacillaceae]MDQ0232415.1 hypothetical protein [Metabacillus malikii]